MNTSYFAKYKKENAVSIAVGTPQWFVGRKYSKLCPPWSLVNDYKNGKITKEEYTEIYNKEILSKLDAKKVYEELGEDAVLLCWEKSGDFCHRHLVADFFKRDLGIEVSEL